LLSAALLVTWLGHLNLLLLAVGKARVDSLARLLDSLEDRVVVELRFGAGGNAGLLRLELDVNLLDPVLLLGYNVTLSATAISRVSSGREQWEVMTADTGRPSSSSQGAGL
jgi:hypothetical protein